ncbi:Uracil DNA glycosylase superfamily [[Eubacterium] infirmum]|nr:Uracil DNA glycosylase superfamily [[Eubacterium] infirmum]
MSIQDIINKIKQDERNIEYTKRNIPPILQVSKSAKILIIGQAPGKKVEETLIPFNDKSGETLISWMGIDKDIFYSNKIAILPMDFYYPGKGKTGDLPPRKFIAEEYHKPILDELDNIELTILVGKYSMDYYLKGRKKKNLTETVRCFDEYLPKYFPIVHPSPLNFRWQAKNPWFLKEVVPVLKKNVCEILEN